MAHNCRDSLTRSTRDNDCNKEGKSKMNLCQYEFRHSVNVLIREVSLFKGEHTPTIMRTSTVSNVLLN